MSEKSRVTKDRLLSEERKRRKPFRIMKETTGQLKTREKQKSRRERQTASSCILRSPGKEGS
jgi:hypothetical protein